MHSRTKHIEIRHHFLIDHVLKGECCNEFIDSEHQLADILMQSYPGRAFDTRLQVDGARDPREGPRVYFKPMGQV